jgi:hypothetical protein
MKFITTLTNVKSALRGLLIVPVLLLNVGLLAPVAVHAAEPTCPVNNVATGSISSGAACSKPTGANGDLFGAKNSIFVTVTNILLFLIGAISVVMLILGGIRYVLSAGDQAAVTSAKNTILYAIIGIIVAFLAYAAVIFVTTQLEHSAAPTAPAASVYTPSQLG